MNITGKMEIDILHLQNLGVPAAPPLRPKQGPRLGSRRHIVVCFPIRLRASPRPTVVVVLPSPAGVGVFAVTKMSLPSGRSSRERMYLNETFALCGP